MKQLVLREPAAVLSVTGPDSYSYLQSQCSQDLRGLAPGDTAYGLWLDRKGKIQGDSHILRLEEERFLLVSHATLPETLLQRLQSNLVADEVDLADVTAGHLLLTAWGGGTAPAPGKFVTETNGAVLTWAGRLTSGVSTESLGPAAAMAHHCGELRRQGYAESGPGALESERVSSGIPLVPVDAGTDTLPQEAGLDEVAVSFTKGCYLGQEVMARLHSLGKAQRSLKKLLLPAPATSLPCPITTAEGREIGLLTSQAEKKGQWLGLGILSRRHLPENRVVFIQGAEVQVFM